MGFLSNAYNKFKSFLPAVHSFAKKGSGFYKESKNYIKDLVDKAASIPFIGEALKQGADKLYKTKVNLPLVGGLSAQDLQYYLDEAASFIDDDHISNLSSQLNDAISPAVDSADRYMSGNPVSAPGGQADRSAMRSAAM